MLGLIFNHKCNTGGVIVKITDEKILECQGNKNVLRQIYGQSADLRREFTDVSLFLAYEEGLRSGRLSRTNQGAVRSSGPIQNARGTERFSTTDARIRECNGDEAILKELYRRSPDLKEEFGSVELFMSYAASIAGRVNV
jgi:hypothetical protein